MSTLFEAESKKAATRPQITDKVGRDLFQSAIHAIVDSAGANAVYSDADVKRLGSTAEQHEAAYKYLALGVLMIEKPSIIVTASGAGVAAGRMLHFSGHTFRQVGQLNRAADAYWRAGISSQTNGSPDDFGTRSLARAKACYADIGEVDLSDEMQFLEWEARRLKLKGFRPLLTAWKWTSRYGTSAGRWLASAAIFGVVFSLFYELLHCLGWLYDSQPWTPFLTAAYYCVVTTATVGFGEVVPSNWVSQIVVAANILLAYVLLAMGATILGRKVLGK